MTGRKIILLLCFAFCFIPGQAQKEATNWVFGGWGGVNFSCATPQIMFTPFDGLEGGASISSADGELLFFTTGDAIWSRDFRIMPNGRGIGGLCSFFADYASASQSSLIVPHPGNADLYYVFTTDCAEDGFVDGVRYAIVDLSRNGGMGDVIEKDKPLVGFTAEKIAAIYQPNGKDVWVVTHGVLSNTFFAFSITAAGLDVVPVVSHAGQVHPGGRGYLKFSPDGNRLAAACFIGILNDGIFPELFKFDKQTGVVTADFILQTATTSVYGVSFSPDSKLLYTTCGWTCGGTTRSIEQFNLEAGTPQEINDQKYVILDEGLQGSAMQLGIDGKLYYMSSKREGPSGTSFLGVIAAPNLVGASCNPNPTFVPLPCWIRPSWGMSNFIESYFQSPVTDVSNCKPTQKEFIDNFDFAAAVDCSDLSVQLDNQSTLFKFDIATPEGSLPLRWTFDFGDGAQVTSALPDDVIHRYTQAGSFVVTLRVNLYDCEVRSIQKTIKVQPVTAQFQYVQDCASLQTNFINETAEFEEVVTWIWNFGDNSPPVTEKSPSHQFVSPGTYTVRLEANSPCNSSFAESIIQIDQPLEISLGPDVDFCFGESLLLGQVQPGASYLWSNQSTEPRIAVTALGEYAVLLRRGPCTASDTIQIFYRDCLLCADYLEYVEKLDAGNDTTICETDAIRLSVDESILWDVLWSTGATDRTIEVSAPGVYRVTISGGNCQVNDEVNVFVFDCTQCDVFIPNVLTPNEDNMNDVFSLIFDCDYYDFRLNLYNRWGRLLLSSESTSWNGFIGNEIVPTGVYYFEIQYSFTGPASARITQNKKGWVQVVK